MIHYADNGKLISWQTGKNPISKPINTSEKPKVNYWNIFAVPVLVILLISSAWFFLNTKNRISSDQQPAISNHPGEIVVTGVLRTSGLTIEEKQKFGLTTIDYQITDFEDYQKAYQEGQIMGYYLMSNTAIDELLGKCVRLTGNVPQEWNNKNKSESYNRLALSITYIEKIDNSSCDPYSQTPSSVENSQEKLVLRGTVIHGKRPAPDISNDYQLYLSEPFTDYLNSSGSPQTVNLVDIAPNTNSVWNELENNINKEIRVEGYMAWGYGESRYLQIYTVNTEKTIDQNTSNNIETIISYGLFYPYSDGITINNSNPTIIGKISQIKSYLPTNFGIENSPVSGENEYFLRFIPGRVKNLEIKIDDSIIPDVYGTAQYPTVLCKRINLNPDGTSAFGPQTGWKKFPPDDIFTSEKECFAQKSADIPPLVFFAKSTNQLSSGKHTLTISGSGKIIGLMIFYIDKNFKLPIQTIAQVNQADYFSSFDTADNCVEGYYYDSNFLKIPLPAADNRNLFYGVSFPQTKEEYGSIKRRKIQIGFEGNRFDLFFPQSSVFYDDKSFRKNTLNPEKALFLPKDLLFFTDGTKANPLQLSPDGGLNKGEYFEIYPVDLSGYEYRGYSMPWQTWGSSGCDG